MQKDLSLKELSKYVQLGKLEVSIAVVFLLLLLFPFPVGGDRFFWKYFFDAGHPILFFICTLFIYRIYLPVNKSKRRVILEAGTASFLISSAIELIQPILGRSASLEDLTLGALGIIPACLVLSPFPVIKVLGPLILILVQSIAFAPASKAMEAIKWRKEHFPILADFEDLKQLPLIRGTYYIQKRHDKQYLKIYQPLGAEYLIRYEAGDKNWSSYKNFHFEILNPLKTNSHINIRIDDDQDCKEYKSRFNKQIELTPGWNKIFIPISDIIDGPETRNLNIEKIRYVYFFILDGNQWFGIDNLLLSS